MSPVVTRHGAFRRLCRTVTSQLCEVLFSCVFFLANVTPTSASDTKRHRAVHVGFYVHARELAPFLCSPSPGCGRLCSLLPISFTINTILMTGHNDETFLAPPRGFGIGASPPTRTNGHPPTNPRIIHVCGRPFFWVKGRLWCPMLRTDGMGFLMAQERVSCRFCLFRF